MLNSMTHSSTVYMTMTSPCDLYGRNARILNHAVKGTGFALKIEKPDENRVCDGASLLGLLKLGVRKGDQIRLVGGEGAGDLSHILAAFDEMAS